MVILDLPLSKEYYTGLFIEKGLRPKVVHSSKTAEMARAPGGGRVWLFDPQYLRSDQSGGRVGLLQPSDCR